MNNTFANAFLTAVGQQLDNYAETMKERRKQEEFANMLQQLVHEEVERILAEKGITANSKTNSTADNYYSEEAIRNRVTEITHNNNLSRTEKCQQLKYEEQLAKDHKYWNLASLIHQCFYSV